jgi:hypothetical protein
MRMVVWVYDLNIIAKSESRVFLNERNYGLKTDRSVS